LIEAQNNYLTNGEISFEMQISLNPSTYKTFKAKNGMTWGEWVNSQYNTDSEI
jgi:hypothetical protein